MSEPQYPCLDTLVDKQSEAGVAEQARKRLRPGERRAQILQALAAMLEQPGVERITTATLAAYLQVSEAALYRHFASKAQMYEGLIDFIEHTTFLLINQITERAPAEGSSHRAVQIITMVLQFAEKNPGLSRVMVGDALVFEHTRLQQRINLFFDKIESGLKQCLQDHPVILASATPTADAQVRASLLTAFLMGRLQRFVRSGFKRLPSESLAASLFLVL